MKGVIADLVPCIGDRAQNCSVLREGGILAYDEKRDAQPLLGQQLKDTRNRHLKVRGEGAPLFTAVYF